MPYAPNNFWTSVFTNAQMQQNQANIDRNRADQLRKQAQEQAQRDKANRQLVEGFRKVYEASPELQQAIPIGDWGDVSPNQINGLISGFAQTRQIQDQQLQQQQAQMQQAQMLANLAAQRRQQQEQQLRAQALAGIYGGAIPSGGAGGGVAGHAPGVYSIGENGRMNVIQGGRAPVAAQSPAAAQQAPGQLAQAGPAAQYAQLLLAAGVSPNNDEITAALKASRVPQLVDAGNGNRFIQDANGNIQRLKNMGPGGAPQVSPDGKFYMGANGWVPIPNAFDAPKPPLKASLDDYIALSGELKASKKTIDELSEKVARGNMYPGADWRKGKKVSHAEQIAAELERQAGIQNILQLAGIPGTQGGAAVRAKPKPAAGAKVIDLGNPQQLEQLKQGAAKRKLSLDAYVTGLEKHGYTFVSGQKGAESAVNAGLAGTRALLEAAREEARKKREEQ